MACNSQRKALKNSLSPRSGGFRGGGERERDAAAAAVNSMTESSAHTGQSHLTGSNTSGINGDMLPVPVCALEEKRKLEITVP